MKKTILIAGMIGLLALAAPLAAQQVSSQGEQRDAKQQARDAAQQGHDTERQMRDAERKMREAEKALQEASRRLAELQSNKRLQELERKVVVFDDHARLGIVLKPEESGAGAADGAVVEGLTPGGPAEEAGLLPGDVITQVNGHSLAGSRAAGSEEPGSPTEKLLDLVTDLKDGDKVTIQFRRGKQIKTATVTARRLGGPDVRFYLSAPGVSKDFSIEMPQLEKLREFGASWVGRPWRDIDMVTLNPDLGSYFGSKEGILVVRAPQDSSMKLKSGDVILKIGDRTPSSPTQALRILRSYDPGEKVNLEIMRHQQKLTLAVVMPKRDFDEDLPVPPEPPEAPAPPAAPAAPRAPSHNQA
jgi:C-terminal processing protease CtpA/Prc